MPMEVGDFHDLQAPVVGFGRYDLTSRSRQCSDCDRETV